MQPGSNHTLYNHRRQHSRVELESCHFFFQHIAWMKCSTGREFPGQWCRRGAVNKSSLWRRIARVSLVWAEYSLSSFSSSTPLFFWRPYALCDFLEFFFTFFFFQRKAFYQFSFFRHQFWTSQAVLDFFFVRPNFFIATWQARHVTSISFLDDFSSRHCDGVISWRPHKLPLLSRLLVLPLVGIASLQHKRCSHLHAFIKGSFLFLW